MSKPNINITTEELEAKRCIYNKMLNDNWHFLEAIYKRLNKDIDKRKNISEYYRIIKWYFALYNIKLSFSGYEMNIGDYKKDGWCLSYNIRTKSVYSITRVTLDDAELKEKREQINKSKCKKFNLDINKINHQFKHKESGELIIWTGFSKSRKFPIAYTEVETQKKMMMTLNLFSKYEEDNNVR